MKPGLGFLIPVPVPTLGLMTEISDYLAAENGNWLGLEAVPPSVSTAPAVTPLTVVDSTVLTTSNGIWSPLTDVFSYTYQWQASANGTSWADVGAATAITYTTPVLVGNYYRCNVTATNVFGSATAASNATSAAEAAPTLALLTETSDILLTQSSLFLGQE